MVNFRVVNFVMRGIKIILFALVGFRVSNFNKKVRVHLVTKDLSVFPPCTSVFRGL